VAILGHESGALVRGERDQIVVTGILGGSRRGLGWILRDRGGASNPPDDCGCLVLVDSCAELRVGERSLELGQEQRRRDERRRPHSRALKIAAGVPDGASSAEMMTLGSRTARNG
jgi:hypothetical protein